MNRFSDPVIGGIGFLLRVIVSEYGLPHIPLLLHRFLIPSRYSLIMLRECSYFLQLNYSDQRIQDEHLQNCPSFAILKLLSPLLSYPYLCLFVGSLLQYLVFLFLSQRSRSMGLLYWLNPISMTCAVLSPLTCIHQFLFSLLIQLSLNSSSPLLLLPPLALLLTSDPSQYLPMIFSLFSLRHTRKTLSETTKRAISPQNLILLALLLVTILLFLSSLLDGFNTQKLLLTSPVRHFQPGPGMLWYLQAQMFPEYTAYFAWFVTSQPYIASLLLLSRLGEINSLATVFLPFFSSLYNHCADLCFLLSRSHLFQRYELLRSHLLFLLPSLRSVDTFFHEISAPPLFYSLSLLSPLSSHVLPLDHERLWQSQLSFLPECRLLLRSYLLPRRVHKKRHEAKNKTETSRRDLTESLTGGWEGMMID